MNEENPQASQNQPDPTEQTAIPQRPHVTEMPQKALRTYESDVADVLAHKNISTAKIALAENKKQTGEERLGESIQEIEQNTDKPQTIKKMLIAILSLILIGSGAVGAYYFYSISPLAQAPAQQNQRAPLSSIVPANKQVVFSIDNMTAPQIINLIKNEYNKTEAAGSIKEIILVQNKNGQKVRVTGSDMATIMDIRAPDIVLRALTDTWMLGIYTDQTGNKDVFVVATNNYFQNAFAGMLQWENVMADDFKQYLFAGSQTYPVIQGSFVDRIIQNKDVREFIGNTGIEGTAFLYSFIDNARLVVTGKESTLEAILSRLEQKAFVR